MELTERGSIKLVYLDAPLVTVECIPLPEKTDSGPWILFVIRLRGDKFFAFEFGDLDQSNRRRIARFMVEDACRYAGGNRFGILAPIPWTKLLA